MCCEPSPAIRRKKFSGCAKTRSSDPVGGTKVERTRIDERRRMAGAGAGWGGPPPCLLRRVGAAPHLAAAEGSRGYPDPRAFREGGRLYGGRICPDRRPA